MKTVVEGDRDGNPVRIYHETGTRTWTHGIATRFECEACQLDRLPEDVRAGEGKADRP